MFLLFAGTSKDNHEKDCLFSFRVASFPFLLPGALAQVFRKFYLSTQNLPMFRRHDAEDVFF